MRSAPHHRPIRVRQFLTLSFALSWLLWLPQWLAALGLYHGQLPYNLLGVLGAWGPGLAALILLWRARGRRGVGGLWQQLLVWRIAPRWYLFALLWPALLSLAVTGLAMGEGHPAPDFVHPLVLHSYPADEGVLQLGVWVLLPLVFITQTLGSSLGEELGWRGLLLPLLQWRYPGLVASVLLGLVWGLWHLPHYWVQHAGLGGYGVFLTQLLLDAVLYTWLYNRSGSLLPVVLFHTSQAMSGLFLSAIDVPFYRFVLTLLPIALALRIHKVDLGLRKGAEEPTRTVRRSA